MKDDKRKMMSVALDDDRLSPGAKQLYIALLTLSDIADKVVLKDGSVIELNQRDSGRS